MHRLSSPFSTVLCTVNAILLSLSLLLTLSHATTLSSSSSSSSLSARLYYPRQLAELSLPAAHRPTSAISVVIHVATAHLFYRGPSDQLLHAELAIATGSVTAVHDLGGILHAAPTAVRTTFDPFKSSPEDDAKVPLSIDVAYPGADHVIVVRCLRLGKWTSGYRLTGIPRTAEAPALTQTTKGDGSVHLFVTAVNKRLTSVVLKDGVLKSKAVWWTAAKSVHVSGAPAALNTYIDDLGVQVFVKDLFDRVHVCNVVDSPTDGRKHGACELVKNMATSVSDLCAATIGEGGQIVIGTDVSAAPTGLTRYVHLDVAEKWAADGKASALYAPGCVYWTESCTFIVVNNGVKTMYELYCN